MTDEDPTRSEPFKLVRGEGSRVTPRRERAKHPSETPGPKLNLGNLDASPPTPIPSDPVPGSEGVLHLATPYPDYILKEGSRAGTWIVIEKFVGRKSKVIATFLEEWDADMFAAQKRLHVWLEYTDKVIETAKKSYFTDHEEMLKFVVEPSGTSFFQWAVKRIKDSTVIALTKTEDVAERIAVMFRVDASLDEVQE